MPSSPKLFHARTSQQSTIPSRSTILIFSGLLVFAIISFIFALSSFLTFGIPSYCCRNFEPRSVRVSWERIENVNDDDDGDKGEGESEGEGGVGYSEMKRHKVTGFVGIQTGFSSTGRRRSLRRTWMPSTAQGLQRLEESTGLAFRFIIGRTNDKSKMVELKKEIDKYDDFLLIDTEEKYSKLPYKTVAFFKAAYALFDAEFYVKADDDIYLRPDRLSLLLVKERSHSLTYLGCMKKGNVFTDPKMKWYEPLSPLLGKEYFLHAHGSIYALSADIVARLAALKNDSFRMFNNEDVTIGAWMLAMNVNHEDIRQLCEPKCTPYSIAVWDMPKCSGLCHPEKKLVQLHKNEACSKSPTLPSSDEDDD